MTQKDYLLFQGTNIKKKKKQNLDSRSLKISIARFNYWIIDCWISFLLGRAILLIISY